MGMASKVVQARLPDGAKCVTSNNENVRTAPSLPFLLLTLYNEET